LLAPFPDKLPESLEKAKSAEIIVAALMAMNTNEIKARIKTSFFE